MSAITLMNGECIYDYQLSFMFIYIFMTSVRCFCTISIIYTSISVFY